MKEKNARSHVQNLAICGMLIAATIVMFFTPLGTIQLPVVSLTIAHIPAIVAAITLGLYPGLVVSLSFGLASLFKAATQASNILDPFFVNPLISVLPRLLIPVTAYFLYKGLSHFCKGSRLRDQIAIGVSVAVGNLTNTFGVYTMLYLLYAKDILEKSGKPATQLIIGAISTTTLLKTAFVVAVSIPVIYALNQAQAYIGRSSPANKTL